MLVCAFCVPLGLLLFPPLAAAAFLAYSACACHALFHANEAVHFVNPRYLVAGEIASLWLFAMAMVTISAVLLFG
jgi:hypothetical protein